MFTQWWVLYVAISISKLLFSFGERYAHGASEFHMILKQGERRTLWDLGAARKKSRSCSCMGTGAKHPPNAVLKRIFSIGI